MFDTITMRRKECVGGGASWQSTDNPFVQHSWRNRIRWEGGFEAKYISGFNNIWQNSVKVHNLSTASGDPNTQICKYLNTRYKIHKKLNTQCAQSPSDAHRFWGLCHHWSFSHQVEIESDKFIHPGNCNSPPRVPNKIRLPSDKTRPMITFCVKLCPFIFLKPLPRNSNKKLSLDFVSVFIISSKQIISPDLYLDNQNPYSCMEAPAASPRLPALPQVIADNCKV